MSETTNDVVTRHRTMLVRVMIVAIGVLVATAAWYFANFHDGVSTDPAAWGQFGDYLGLLNPIFALFALFALLYTIVLQVRELRDTKIEIAKTVEAAKHQTFEDTFFQMLRLHHQIVGGSQVIVQKKDSRTGLQVDHQYTGRKALSIFAQEWGAELNAHLQRPNRVGTERDEIENAWGDFLSHEYGELGHYFRNLYTIIKYVDEAREKLKIDVDEKQHVNIVRAQLSGYEFYLLFYNCLLLDHAPFKKLIEKYEFLEHVSSGRAKPFMPISDVHYLMYEKKAYGKRPPSAFQTN